MGKVNEESSNKIDLPSNRSRPGLTDVSQSQTWRSSLTTLPDLLEISKSPSTTTTIEYSWVGRFLTILLGITAFLDFSAAMASRHIEEKDRVAHGVIRWLQEHDDTLGICFSLVWFVDAFVWAHRTWLRAAQRHDMEALLDNNCYDKVEWWKGFRGVYYRTVLVQVLLLPVGFFVFWYGLIVHDPSSKLEIVHHDEHVEDEAESFSSHAKISLIFAILKHLSITIARRTGTKLRLQWKTILHSFIWRNIRFGIRHPRAFFRKVKRTLRAIRWIQYLAPLLGAMNKLKGNLADLLKKYKQHRDMVRANRIRRRLWARLSLDELREVCALKIQNTFRSHRTRRKLHALKILQGKTEMIAAIRLQKVFRGSLARARARLKGKWKQLRELKEKQKEALREKKGAVMSVEERRRMYELEEELEARARALLNEKLLLRPNTTFAVTWKVIFVVAVLFEISILACKPLLVQHKDKHGKPLDIESIMEDAFIPVPVRNQTQCMIQRPARITWKNPMRSVTRIKELVFERNKYKNPPPPPWWCSGWYPKLQGVFIDVMNLCIHNFLVIVSVICFADVFVNFFMGQYNTETGVLEPKPFFTRWILPGLLLQLLVNPKMEGISGVVFRALAGLLHHGPIRVLRWTLSLFFPLFLHIIKCIQKMWYSSTAFHNQNLVAGDTWRSLFAQSAVGATNYVDL